MILWHFFLTFWVDTWLQMTINTILLTILLYRYKDSAVFFVALDF